MAHPHDATPEYTFTDDYGPGRTSAETAWRWQQAGERRDIELARSLLAPDVVLRMPATDQWSWEGASEVIELLTMVFRTLEVISFQDDLGNEDVRVLRLLGRVQSVDFEEVHFLWFDGRHRVREAAFFIRPGLGLAAVTEALGPQILHANHSRGLGKIAHHFLRTARRVIDKVDRHIIPRGVPNREAGSPMMNRGSEG